MPAVKEIEDALVDLLRSRASLAAGRSLPGDLLLGAGGLGLDSIAMVELLLVAGDPGSGGEAWECALAASAGRWLESYLLESPAEISLGLLRLLLAGDLIEL